MSARGLQDYGGLLIKGWKQIAEVTGLGCPGTCKTYARQYKMPYFRMRGKPVIMKMVLENWLLNLHETILKANPDGEHPWGKPPNLQKVFDGEISRQKKNKFERR